MPSGKTYRALLIGEETHYTGYDGTYIHYERCTRNTGDMNNMAALLNSISGPDGGKYNITKKQDADYYTILSLIKSALGPAGDNDVSLFFIATHGNSGGDGELQMPMVLSDEGIQAFFDNPSLSFDTLARWLNDNVKGEVIVILESCGAGSAIYSSAEENNIANADGSSKGFVFKRDDSSTDFKPANYSASTFVSDAIGAFSAKDHSFVVKNAGVGSLRQENKFYVLAAARHGENSWGSEQTHSNFFTDWLIQGAKGPADTDGDRLVDLHELFVYIDQCGDEMEERTRGSEQEMVQHVQRYPVNNRYGLFRY